MTQFIFLLGLAASVHAAFTDIYPASLQSGTTGFKILGSANTVIGDRVSTAGDFNGDGLADILFASIGPRKFYVVFGRLGSSAFPTINIVNFVSGDSTGFALTNVDMTGIGWLGASAIGDVNGDGLDDVAFGAPAVDYAGRTDVGVVYVVYGRQTGIADINAGTWVTSSTNGYRMYGERAGDSFGNQVLKVGDFNEDGTNDYLVYALNGDLPNNGENNYGVTYVIFGKGAPYATDIDMLSGFTYGTQGFRVYSAADLNAVPGACGDVNNDGIDDIAVTAGIGTYSGRAYCGAVYVLFGHSTATTFADVYLSAFVSGSAGVLIIGAATFDNLGQPAQGERGHPAAVGRGGDFNGDGLNDLAIGAMGKAYVLFGRQGVASYSDIDLAAWPDSVNKGQRFVAQNAGSFGAIRLISSLDDYNGDGVSDVFAFNAAQNGNAGWGAVFFGHPNTTAYEDILFETFNTGTTGFRLLSSDGGSYFGIHAGNAGDVNGDGAPDLVVSATLLSVNGEGYAGTVYAVYGQGPPTSAPTAVPTVHPTAIPTSQPSSRPSNQPSSQPSTQPSTQPSINPDALQSVLASPTYKVRN
jgi:hypothetical protein